MSYSWEDDLTEEKINSQDVRPVRPPLNRHIDFFDTDGDGIVWPTDTIIGLHALGFSWSFAALIGIIGHLGFAHLTIYHPGLSDITSLWTFIIYIPWLLWTYVPDPFMRIYAKNLEFAKHSCSTNSWRKDGSFSEEAFDKIWEYSSAPNKDSLNYDEAMRMIKSYRHGLSDGTGLFKGPFEWSLLFWVVNPPDGRVTKEEVKWCFQGTLFQELVKRRQGQSDKGYSTLAKKANTGW